MSKERPFTANEAVVLWVLLRNGRTYLNELIREYSFHPQQAYRVLNRLSDRGIIVSEWRRQLRSYKLSQKGTSYASMLANHQPILSSNFKLLRMPSGGRIINAGGGTCEIARRYESEVYHVHFPFLASMRIPPWQLYARATEGIPFIFFGNNRENQFE